MEDRRTFLQSGLTSLGLVVFGAAEGSTEFAIKTIYQQDLPPVSLDRWQVTALELTYPPGLVSPKHLHPGFVLGYVLEGEFRLCMEGEPAVALSSGEMFYEAPGKIHMPSRSASGTSPARPLALAFGEKGKEIIKLL